MMKETSIRYVGTQVQTNKPFYFFIYLFGFPSKIHEQQNTKQSNNIVSLKFPGICSMLGLSLPQLALLNVAKPHFLKTG